MDLWHTLFFFFMDFFSSDFTDESEAVLLIGLLTDLRRYLAAGQWLAPDMCCCCFLVTQISQMTQIFLRGIILSHRFHRFTQIFLRGIIFVPQISQIYTDFFHRKVFHRISRMNQRQPCLSDYSRIFAELWPLANGWRPIYAPVFCPTDFTDFYSWESYWLVVIRW